MAIVYIIVKNLLIIFKLRARKQVTLSLFLSGIKDVCPEIWS